MKPYLKWKYYEVIDVLYLGFAKIFPSKNRRAKSLSLLQRSAYWKMVYKFPYIPDINFKKKK